MFIRSSMSNADRWQAKAPKQILALMGDGTRKG
jgi:hypothetical protein